MRPRSPPRRRSSPAPRGSTSCACSEERIALATNSTFDFGLQPAQPASRTRDGVGPALLLVAAFLAVIIFFPPEGRISAPLHAVVDTLFGRTAFALPTGCALIGMLMLVRTLSPNVVLPGRRLVGLAILVVAVLVAEHVLAGADDGTGLVGAWLTSLFVDLLGPALTALVVLTALTLGTALVFGVRLTPRARRPSPHAES